MAVPSDCILHKVRVTCTGERVPGLGIESYSLSGKPFLRRNKRQPLALIGPSNQCKLIAVQKFHSQQKPLPSMSHLIQFFSKVSFRNNI